MKHLIIFLFVTTSLAAQTKLYVHSEAKKYVENTKTIAILPLVVEIKLRPRELKEFTQEEIVELGKKEAIDIQKAMYSWFLTRKKRGTLLVDVQNPSRTNALLKKAGIDIYNYNDLLPSEIGEILGAETIVTGSFETDKPLSTGAAIGLALLTGGVFTTNTATLNMDFTSTIDDELVVNYLKKVRGSIGSNSEDLINILMRKVSRRIPYTK